MATKKYLKKEKKRSHKRKTSKCGGEKIKINYDKVRDIVKKTFEYAIQAGSTVTKIMLINAICDVLHIAITNENMGILFEKGIDIIIASFQFILYSLRLTADITASTISSASNITSYIGSSLWSSVQSILNVCNQNPIPSTIIGSVISTTVALKQEEIRDIFQQLQNYGAIDAISMMLFDLLIRSGIAEDTEGHNQLKLTNDNIQELVDNISDASRQNTPVSSQASSPASSQNEELLLTNEESLEEAKQQFALLLQNTVDAVNSISENYENFPALAPEFYNDAMELNVCGKRKYEFGDTIPSNELKMPNINYINDETNDDDENLSKGGKRTRHKKKKHNKYKTKKQKKHIKKQKKHTKKH